MTVLNRISKRKVNNESTQKQCKECDDKRQEYNMLTKDAKTGGHRADTAASLVLEKKGLEDERNKTEIAKVCQLQCEERWSDLISDEKTGLQKEIRTYSKEEPPEEPDIHTRLPGHTQLSDTEKYQIPLAMEGTIREKYQKPVSKRYVEEMKTHNQRSWKKDVNGMGTKARREIKSFEVG